MAMLCSAVRVKKRLMARHDHIRKAHQHRHDLIAQHIVGEVFKHLTVLILIDIQPHTGKFAAAQRVDERPRVDQPARLVLTSTALSRIIWIVSALIMW